MQTAGNSLGHSIGPLVGGVLFIWQTTAPYVFAGALLIALALMIGWNAMVRQRKLRAAA
jgi:DHA1 family multidrug resistance protein-like MFS transporter